MPDQTKSTWGKLWREFLLFLIRLAPVITAFMIVYGAIDRQWGETINAWKEMPERLDRIEARLGEVPELPFVEFMPTARMWPETVQAGDTVRIVYVLRRNRDCAMTVDRQFQRVSASSIDPALSTTERAATPPLTIGYEVFTVPVTVPASIGPGLFAYRPVLRCDGEQPVEPPAVFFEVRE